MLFRGMWGYRRGKGMGNYTLTDTRTAVVPGKIKMIVALP